MKRRGGKDHAERTAERLRGYQLRAKRLRQVMERIAEQDPDNPQELAANAVKRDNDLREAGLK